LEVIYLDNAATTRVSKGCAEAALRVMTEVWGNPSSRHRMGMDAEDILRDARRTVASEIGAREDEIFFTSGGTEANNLAVLGAARGRGRAGSRVIISSVEHASVNESAAQLEAEGFEVVRIAPRDGVIQLEDVAAALTENTVLVSMMLVNNEMGTVLPIAEISRLIKRTKSRALLHCDAVQGFGRLAVTVSSLGCDLLTLSGHKIHAPKGIGALYCKKEVQRNVRSLVYGGAQQEKLRPGTEPLPNIAALAQAVKELPRNPAQRLEKLSALNAFARSELSKRSEIIINSPENGAPHILSIATGCIKSETLLNFHSSKGICVSSGSACSKGKKSRVLTEFGLSDHIADSTVRISFSDDSTEQHVLALCQALDEALATLARFRK